MINCSPLQPDKGANITAGGPVTVIISVLSEEEPSEDPPADLNLQGKKKKRREEKGTKYLEHQRDKYQPGVQTGLKLEQFVMNNTTAHAEGPTEPD